MLVNVKDANEDAQESCRTTPAAATQAAPAVVEETSNVENGYPFIKEEEEVWPRKRDKSPRENQLAIRIQYDKVTIEFFGHGYYTSRDFAVFMEKVGGKRVSNR